MGLAVARFRVKKIVGLAEARLPVSGILVLTHNFEVGKPVVTRLSVFTICGMWLQRWLWQNCKSKQASLCL